MHDLENKSKLTDLMQCYVKFRTQVAEILHLITVEM